MSAQTAEGKSTPGPGFSSSFSLQLSDLVVKSSDASSSMSEREQPPASLLHFLPRLLCVDRRTCWLLFQLVLLLLFRIYSQSYFQPR